MALDKTCKERQHDSPREEPAYSIEKQPTELALSLFCLPAPSVVLCRIVRERQRGRESDGKRACRLTFQNSPGVMVFP